jgi:hypothetical protein
MKYEDVAGFIGEFSYSFTEVDLFIPSMILSIYFLKLVHKLF